MKSRELGAALDRWQHRIGKGTTFSRAVTVFVNLYGPVPYPETFLKQPTNNFIAAALRSGPAFSSDVSLMARSVLVASYPEIADLISPTPSSSTPAASTKAPA